MLCRWVDSEITALADGERTGWRAALARRHLASCGRCAARRAETERSVDRQRHLLPRVLFSTDVPTDAMFAEVTRRLGAEPVALPVERQYRPRLIFASAAGAIVLVLALRLLNPVWIVLGIESPPPRLADAPDLFRDYELFQHLDLIENLDQVPDSDAPDADPPPAQDGQRSVQG
jgi:anti-sigma factor RsiW